MEIIRRTKVSLQRYRETSAKVFHVIFQCYELWWGFYKIWGVDVDEAFVNVTVLVE